MQVVFTQDHKGPQGTFKKGEKRNYSLPFLRRLPRPVWKPVNEDDLAILKSRQSMGRGRARALRTSEYSRA